MLRLSKTRWQSLNNVVERVAEQWNPSIYYFNLDAHQDGIDTAKSILVALENPTVKANFLYLFFFFFLPSVCLSSVEYLLEIILKYYMDSKFVSETLITNIYPDNK